jgi:hypothetical protein
MKVTPPALKQTQVYTWELEPSDERPSQFASFTFSPTSARPSEFQDSSFMDPAPDRLSRRGGLLAALCFLTILGGLVAVLALSA